ncbi:MAG: hypothetical protein LC794_03095 [Acidobacteria bacterium]|nr:hypothetical protein [Acidobacteriota bacterium]
MDASKLEDHRNLSSQRNRSRFLGAQLWTALLLAIVVAVLTRDVWLLFRHPVAVGLDGYFYVLQLENLYNNGTLFFRSSTPLVIYLLSALKFVINDTVFVLKLGALLFHVMLVGGVYAILVSLTRSKLHAMCGTLIVATSSVHLFMLAEYVANAGGLALFVWGAYFTIRALRIGKTLLKISAISCFACAALSHRSLLFIIGALAVASLIYYLIAGVEASRSRKLWAGGIALVLFISPSVLALQTFIVLPELVRDSLLASPQLPVGRVAIVEKFLLLVCSVLFLLVTSRKHRPLTPLIKVVLGSVVMLSLLVTINPFLDRSNGWSSASERISALAYVQLAVLLPALLWLLSPLTKRLWRLGPMTAICFAALSLAKPLPHGLRDDYLRDRASLLNELTERRLDLADVRTVIAPHGNQFVITYALGVAAHQRVRTGEDVAMAHWLIQGLDGVDVDSVEGLIVLNEEKSTFLVPDRYLDALLRARPIKKGLELTKANPHLTGRVMSLAGTYRVSVK